MIEVFWFAKSKKVGGRRGVKGRLIGMPRSYYLVPKKGGVVNASFSFCSGIFIFLSKGNVVSFRQHFKLKRLGSMFKSAARFFVIISSGYYSACMNGMEGETSCSFEDRETPAPLIKKVRSTTFCKYYKSFVRIKWLFCKRLKQTSLNDIHDLAKR